MAEIQMKHVQCLCRNCGKIDEFDIPQIELDRRREFGTPLAAAFSSLAAARIEQLRDNICPDCQALEQGVVADADQAVR